MAKSDLFTTDIPTPRNRAGHVLESPRMTLAPVPTPASVPGAVPPQNLEAEESVLGAMMLSPNAIAAVTEILDASDFYRESHAKIYRAALQLYGKNEPVDAITLTNELEQRGELDEIGGRVRPHQLARPLPAPPHPPPHAEIGPGTAAPPTPPPLRGDRSGDGDTARPDPRRRRDRAARLGPRGRAGGARGPRRAARVRARRAARRRRARPLQGRIARGVPDDQQALRVGRRGDGARERIQGPRPHHRRLPAREPRDHRRPPVDG